MTREELLHRLEILKISVYNAFSEIDELNTACKSVLINALSANKCFDHFSVVRIQAVIDYMYEQINIGNWREVKLFLRKTITIATFLKLFAHVKVTASIDDNFIKESFKIIDYGMLFGCPLDGHHTLLQKCATLFNKISTQPLEDKCIKLDKIITDNKLAAVNVDLKNLKTYPIEEIDCPSMEYFYKNFILQKKPVILNNCINHWPALNKWQNPNYFKILAGSRTVPVELGRVYTDADWTQKLMTLGEFIDNYIYQSNGPTGYLAQYQLFEQIPELKDDIVEPDYCCFSDDEPIEVMAWFGPKGTVSALHHDPKRNLLTQVVGTKQLFLFSPDDSEFVYPHSDELLNNTAQVDPREPDLERFPKYENAKAYHCMLRPGQMLYIPPKWWHFVESLSMSFSVSFWWNSH